MASKRCIPTRFFKDPDIVNLGSKDAQLILIGLVLAADDEGRELAHANVLGREMDYQPEQIEAALQELVANDLLILYQVGKHRYYSLTRWSQWQSLGNKMTPSKHPAPPQPEVSSDSLHSSEESPEDDGNLPRISGKSGESSAQLNLRESKGSESNSREDDGEHLRSNVVAFPTARTGDDTTDVHEIQIRERTEQVAHILKLPQSEALHRVVGEYITTPEVSLLGEADAAREWIDDPRRNRKHTRMTPAFFRRWLKREVEDVRKRQSESVHATGTTGHGHLGETTASPSPRCLSPSGRRSLMGLEAQYQAEHVRGKGESS